MSWIKWESVLTSKSHGGLDIGSLVSFTFALLQK